MKSKLLNWLAVVVIIQIGLIHLFTAQSEYDEAAYLGFLFVANFIGALISAYGIYRRSIWGWILGLVVAAGSIAGFLWSRTLGMPGMGVEEWFTPYGIIAMVLESIFVLLFLFLPWKASSDEIISSPAPRLPIIFPITGLLIMVSVSLLAYRWDSTVAKAYGYHVSSLEEVVKTSATSSEALEKQYGIQVLQAATSMMGSIVDVRIKIVDPDKAHKILVNQTALLVGQQVLVKAPHMHSHTSTRMPADKVFVVFFPTQQTIHTGSQVSLVLGSIRTDPVFVK